MTITGYNPLGNLFYALVPNTLIVVQRYITPSPIINVGTATIN